MTDPYDIEELAAWLFGNTGAAFGTIVLISLGLALCLRTLLRSLPVPGPH